MDKRNYILLGPPGSGKSTQAGFFKERLQLAHLDMGAELRAVASEDSDFGREVAHIIYEKKELVSDEIVERALRMALEKADPEKGIILDGAPRRESQIEEVIAVLKEFGREIDEVIFIDLPKEASIDRISRRFSCSQCGEKFILGLHPEDHAEPCYKCGGKLTQRKDDTPEGVETRWRIFHEETNPVIEYFSKQGKLLHVDGRLPAEGIFQAIIKEIGERK